MLKKQNRLKNKKDFDLVFKKGRSVFSEILGIKFLKNSLNINRFGVIVGLKVSKKAVERNLIKKQIKNILRSEDVFLRKGNDFVIITLPKIKNKKFKEIQLEIKNSFKKLNVC